MTSEDIKKILDLINALKEGAVTMGHGAAEGAYNLPLDIMVLLNGGEGIDAPYTPYAEKFNLTPGGDDKLRDTGRDVTNPIWRLNKELAEKKKK